MIKTGSFIDYDINKLYTKEFDNCEKVIIYTTPEDLDNLLFNSSTISVDFINKNKVGVIKYIGIGTIENINSTKKLNILVTNAVEKTYGIIMSRCDMVNKYSNIMDYNENNYSLYLNEIILNKNVQ